MGKFLETVRRQRGLPFLKRGMKVHHTYSNRFGVITGANAGGNINVRFNGDSHSQNCHPCWMMIYFDKNGGVIKEFKGDNNG